MEPPPLSLTQRQHLRRRLAWLALALLLVIALTIAWSWSPLREVLNAATVAQTLRRYGQGVGPGLAIAAFALALTAAVPLTFLTLVVLLAFDPWTGFAVALTGALMGAGLSYGLGAWLGRQAVQQLAGTRVHALSARLAEHGLLAVIAVRMVPVAPFAVVNMVAGSSHIKLRDLLLGTAIGMTPGTLLMMVFTDQIVRALTQPSRDTLLLAALTVALIAIGALGLRRWLRSSERGRKLTTRLDSETKNPH